MKDSKINNIRIQHLNSKLSFLFFLLSALSCFAQDPSFSQFYANRINLNPAFTGIEPGLTLAAVSRLQWLNIDNGFQTQGVTAEIQEPFIKSGFGLAISTNKEGIAELTTTGIGLSYSYTVPFQKSNLHFGIQGQWVQKSVNWDNLIFSDELDPALGVVNPTTAAPILQRVSYTDINFGMMYRSENKIRLGKSTYRNIRSLLGLSINHLPSLFGDVGASESFQALPTKVPARITLHAGAIIPVIIFEGAGNKFSLSPNIKFDIQGENIFQADKSLRVLSFGMYTLYEGFHFGAFFQNTNPFPDLKNTNALILSFGFYQDGKRPANHTDQRFFVGFSIDINTTGVGTRGGNVYELNLRYTFADMDPIFLSRKGTKPKQILDCKNFLY
jgi:type IX secretion system PorP/SprF family membrane protein